MAATTRSATPTGRLEFRMAPTIDADGDLRIDHKRHSELVAQLAEYGPDEIGKSSPDLIWVETTEIEPYLIAGNYKKIQYLLLSNSPVHTMLYDGTWGLTSAFAATNEMAKPAIGVAFDDAGAAKFKDLTSSHLKQLLVCVLDGKVIWIAMIHSTISRSATISVNEMTEEEAAGIIDTLNAPIRTSASATTRPSATTSATRAVDIQQQAEDWVSNFLSTSADITAFKALEFGKAETLANGNSRLRARIEGEIRGQDRFVQDSLFEFAPDGRLADMRVLKPAGGPPLGIDLTLNPASKPGTITVVEVQLSADPVFNWMPPPDAELTYMGFFVAPISTPEVATIPQQQNRRGAEAFGA